VETVRSIEGECQEFTPEEKEDLKASMVRSLPSRGSAKGSAHPLTYESSHRKANT